MIDETKTSGSEKVLKHITFGVEFELFTLDKEGQMVNEAEQLIKNVKRTAPQIDIVDECGKNMVELRSFPDKKIPNSIEKLMSDLETVLHCAEKEEATLYFYGTYPGYFTPKINQKKPYLIKEKIFGKTRFLTAAGCIGMHCHYSLPRGVFDFSKRNVKDFKNSKNMRVLANMYNLFIAMDPAMTTLCQSSPFYNGRFIGKDSRVIIYRGGKTMDFEQGLYTDYPQFGELPDYELTENGLTELLSRKYDNWKTTLEKKGFDAKTISGYWLKLDTNWGPVKINPHGTLEQRGMDMNSPRITVAVATLAKSISKMVHDSFIEIVPLEEGTAKEFFLFEGNKIFVPPSNFVRNVLQPKSAYVGLEDNEVYNYCKNLLALGKKFVEKEKLWRLEPLNAMIEKRKTVSDEIIETAKKIGIDTNSVMQNEQAAELALSLSKNFFKEVILTKQGILNSTPDY